MARSFLVRLMLFGFLWAVLNGGAASSVWAGAVVAAIVAAVSLRFVPRRSGRIAIAPALRLLGRIPVESLRAGADVALRALRPSLPIRPAVVDVPLPGVEPGHRVALTYLITILPGSICVRWGRGGLSAHLIDDRQPFGEHLASLHESLRAVERAGGHG